MENLLKKAVVEPAPTLPPKPVDVIAKKYVAPVRKVTTRHVKKPIKIRVRPSVSKTEYLSHLPTLLMSLVGYGAAVFLLWRVQPESIQNTVISNTYLPLLLALAEGHFFFFSFVFMNSRRGLLITVVLTLLLFLKLQQLLTVLSGVVVISPFVIAEVFWVLSDSQ